MSQRKKDAYFFESVSAKCITNGEYELLEPLDFYEWLELIQNGTATDRHHEEYHLRVLMHFADKVFNDEVPDKLVMNLLANAFFKITQGGRWEDEIPLPWTKISMAFSPAELKDLEIFCEVSNNLNDNPGEVVIAWVLVWCCILILNTIIGFKPCKRKETLN